MVIKKYIIGVPEHLKSSFNIIINLIHTLLVAETHMTNETNEIAIGEISILCTGPGPILVGGR